MSNTENLTILKPLPLATIKQKLGGRFARDKGARGELEVIGYLQPLVDKAYRHFGFEDPPELRRNLMQYGQGGFDLANLDGWAIEVKRQETQQVEQWWVQTVRNARHGRVPALLWRANHKPWRARFVARLEIDERSRLRCVVNTELECFLAFFEFRMYQFLAKKYGVGYDLQTFLF